MRVWILDFSFIKDGHACSIYKWDEQCATNKCGFARNILKHDKIGKVCGHVSLYKFFNINENPEYKKSKFPENLPKYVYLNFQIWFPKYKFKHSKYIKNVEVHSLRTPGLKYSC